MKICCLLFLCIVSSAFAQSPVSDEALRDIELTGYELHFRDFLAASATNIVSIERLQNSEARGWIIVKDGDDWIVRFVGDCEESLCSSFDVAFNVEDNSARLTEFEVPEVIPDAQQKQWRARELALGLEIQRCSETYNTVVLESRAGTEPVWLVYLLAATSDPNVVMLGGHYRITVSADGTRIISNEPLTKSCLQLAKSPDGAALTANNLLTQEPLETHVFASLLYKIPIHVSTGLGTFVVEGRQIRFTEQSSTSTQNGAEP